MNKTTRDKIKALVEDCYEEIEEEIANNQYKPSERGAGTATRESTQLSNVEIIEDIIIKVLALFDIKESLADYTFDEILKETNSDNFNLDSYHELRDVETIRDADADPKYVYKYIYYLHNKENRTMELCLQDGGDYPDNFMHVEEVKKVEVVTNQYKKI